MGLKLVSPSAVDAITLTEAKAHLRITDSDNDAVIQALIKSACNHAEVFMGRALIDQTWDLYLDSFPGTSASWSWWGYGSTAPSSGAIKIPKPPLIEVQSVNYFAANGIETQVDPLNYYVDNVSQPGWIVTQNNVSWPTTLNAINAVRVRFRAGYLDTNSPPGNLVPEDIKAAIKLMLGSLYEIRETQGIGSDGESFLLPWGAEQLMRQHRIELSMA